MTKDELKEKIRVLVKQVYVDKAKTTLAAAEYDELTKFPELKKVLVDLLTPDFDFFLASIDWVAPRPTTFRINLKNGTSFYLIFTPRSWIAQVEGKKYYLLNLNEEESACEAIARQLRYQVPVKDKPEEEAGGGAADITSTETTSTSTETEEETPA
jgi:hypothetical protein